MTMTLSDLVQYARQHPEQGDCVLHLSVPEVTYSPIVSVKHEPSQDGPGCMLLELDPYSEICLALDVSNE